MSLKKEFSKQDIKRMRNLISGDVGERTSDIIGSKKSKEEHKEGDIWEEDGKRWTIQDGVMQNITRLDKIKNIMSKEFNRMQQLAGLIKENEEEGGISSFKGSYSTVLTPKGASAEEVDAAFEDIENYGIYKTQALRNASLNKAQINKAIDDHFGPSIPSRKKAALKLRGGEPFPIRTKQSIDDFMKQFSGKPKLLSWVVKDNTIHFSHQKNPNKKQLDDVIAAVMNAAGIEYELTQKEEI